MMSLRMGGAQQDLFYEEIAHLHWRAAQVPAEVRALQ
jgi:hypothetical protein